MTDDKSTRIEVLRREAADCRACPLWRNATQTVFGEGPADADIVFVGEQPGDREDRAGRPFVCRTKPTKRRPISFLCRTFALLANLRRGLL